ncbi:hypothetical protein MtrunA17_Chr7g0275851 [Medicago truncatula]|uniref:DUF688 family protein n=2 Tax=Medicago truncatula TaxID=3880 RepID=A0A396HCP9_MEDTR|nr:hypothetical protein MtrunA17_Chr7g0275851 [Medicago truncatula]
MIITILHSNTKRKVTYDTIRYVCILSSHLINHVSTLSSLAKSNSNYLLYLLPDHIHNFTSHPSLNTNTVFGCFVMGSEAKAEQESSIPRLPLFSVSPAAMKIQMQMESPERTGTVTPPLQTSGSVPFLWEQEPGKPRLCNALVPFTNPSSDKCLELPPRLLLVPSPTLLQQGPHVTSNRFRSPSFRIEDNNCYGSSFSTDKGLLGSTMNILIKRDSGWFGSWRKNVKRDQVSGGSHVFPSSSTDKDTGTIDIADNNKIMKRSGSSSSLSHHGKSPTWTTIRKGMKQVVTLPWRSKKLKKKDGSGLKL